MSTSAGPAGWTWIGRDLPRADSRLKVMGGATFAAEWDVPGLAYGAVVGAAVSRGTITSIDVSAALAAAGVITVVTHENARRLGPYPQTGAGFALQGDGGLGEVLQPLQGPAVHYGGQSVAVVVAATSEQATYAASLVCVEYDVESPQLDPDTATDAAFPDLFAGSEPLQVGGEEVLAAIARAPVRLDLRYDTPVYHHNPIELLCTTAIWGDQDAEECLTLYDTTRATVMLRGVLASSFDLPTENVRVVSKWIGGAFGSKAWSYHAPLLVALAAWAARQPVRVEWSRQQVYSVGGHRPATRQRVRLGATPQGKLLGLQHDGRTHSSTVGGFVENSARMTRMMYDVPHLGYTNRLTHLNLPTPATMRGPGFLVSGWGLESALDELAHETGVDPVVVRLRNHADVDPMSGLPFSNKHLRECYSRGAEQFGWAARSHRPRAHRDGETFVGHGMASSMHPADRQRATSRATIFSDGTALVRTATHELGNGAYTVFRQIAADGLSLPLTSVRFELGDSSLPFAQPTHGSITTATVGPAVLEASRNAVRALTELTVRDPGSVLFGTPVQDVRATDGRLHRRDEPTAGVTYGEALTGAGLPHISAGAAYEPGDELERYAFYSFGAVFAQVRVDEPTGVVRVERLCGVYDVGRLLNPRTAHSQLMGGMLFGLGASLTEESLFDPATGLPVVRNLADYHLPSAADTPDISIEVVGVPDPHVGELGAHGVGEMGGNGVPAAIAAAIFNATGRRVRSLPLTPDKVLTAPVQTEASQQQLPAIR